VNVAENKGSRFVLVYFIHRIIEVSFS